MHVSGNADTIPEGALDAGHPTHANQANNAPAEAGPDGGVWKVRVSHEA